jgi:PPP family 3-phenylpropionic acid transporter
MNRDPTFSHPLLTWRIPLFYVLSFAILGAVIPYLPKLLLDRQITGTLLATAVGALPLGRLIAGPLWSIVTDRTQAPKLVLVLGAVLGTIGLLGLREAEGGWTVLAVLVLSIGRAPMGPVVDAISLSALGDRREDYGSVRRWGSIGFMLGALGSGVLMATFRVSPLDLGIVLSIPLLLLILEIPLGRSVETTRILPALKALVQDRVLGWLLLAAALHFASHVGSTSFLAVHLDALGYAESWTGVILSMGVIVEIGIMSRARVILKRFTAQRLFMAAILVATPRWLLTASVDNAWLLLLLQAGHGFTFGAFWLAGVALVAERAPKGVETSAQGLFAAAVGGVGAMIGMVGASIIVDSAPTHHLFLWGAGASGLAIGAAWLGIRDSTRPTMPARDPSPLR